MFFCTVFFYFVVVFSATDVSAGFAAGTVTVTGTAATGTCTGAGTATPTPATIGLYICTTGAVVYCCIGVYCAVVARNPGCVAAVNAGLYPPPGTNVAVVAAGLNAAALADGAWAAPCLWLALMVACCWLNWA